MTLTADRTTDSLLEALPRCASDRAAGSAGGPCTGRVIGGVVGGRYRLEACVGQGTGGVVYRARHVETGGDVALKFLKASAADPDAAAQRFLEEARHTHRLRHPNTVRLYDYGRTADGTPFLAMEYLEGRTLAELVESEGRVDPLRALHITVQILRSLGEAHAVHLIHRDVKPQNVMLLDLYDEPDFVKVLDFGVARVLAAESDPNTGPAGSPICMAPEQWMGTAVDRRTDLYAVGCMLYELLSGRPPFVVKGHGKRKVVRYMLAHLHNQPTPLEEVAPGVCPPPLVDLVLHLLQKDPRDRPAHAGVVLSRLEEIQSALDLRAVPRAHGRQATRTPSRSDRPPIEPSSQGERSVSAVMTRPPHGAPAAGPGGRSSGSPTRAPGSREASGGAARLNVSGGPPASPAPAGGASSPAPLVDAAHHQAGDPPTRPRTGRRRQTSWVFRALPDAPAVDPPVVATHLSAHASVEPVTRDRATFAYGLVALLLAVIFGAYIYLGVDLFFGADPDWSGSPTRSVASSPSGPGGATSADPVAATPRAE